MYTHSRNGDIELYEKKSRVCGNPFTYDNSLHSLSPISIYPLRKKKDFWPSRLIDGFFSSQRKMARGNLDKHSARESIEKHLSYVRTVVVS